MKTGLTRFAIISIVIILFTGLAYGQLPNSEMTDRAARSLVSIISFDIFGRPLSSGSGFFINTMGDITTNHHVLAGSEKAIIETSGGKKGIIVEVIKNDPNVDLAIARTSIRNSIPLHLGDSDKIEMGEDIVVLGESPGAGRTISLGIIKGVIEAKGIRLIEITASIRPGRSGSPVLSSNGKVVGIATAFLDYGRKNNFAMPINYLKSLRPTRLDLRALPRRVASFDAVVEDERLLEMLDRKGKGFTNQKHDDPNGKKPNLPGTVYFKNGKRLICERAWKDGDKVYLLVHKKEIAISYDEDEIEMERSFVQSTGSDIKAGH